MALTREYPYYDPIDTLPATGRPGGGPSRPAGDSAARPRSGAAEAVRVANARG